MLLTLAVSSLRALVQGASNGDALRLKPLEIPAFARETLGLHALNVPAWMLRGWTMADLDRLRDVADKAGCPCLLLVDDEPLELGASGATARDAALDRFQRLAAAAHRLGCNALAMAVKGGTGAKGAGEEAFERTVTALKAAIGRVDRLELNVLLRPGPGLGEDPARLTELIKRVGGFRIGSLPDFGHAGRSGQPELTLRKLAPYAGAIHATIEGFDASGQHTGCDLAACVHAIRSVGYQNTLAIEYVGKGDPVADVLRAKEILVGIIRGDSAGEEVEVDDAAVLAIEGDDAAAATGDEAAGEERET
ncbi:MAG: TIM barrel protein [Phycisphaerales bacterium]